MTLRIILFCFLIGGVTSKDIHLAILNHTEVGSDCPRSCLYAEEDRMTFHGTATRSRDEALYWEFENIEIIALQHSANKWRRVCRPDFRYCRSYSEDACYCNRRISYERRSFVVNVTAQLKYSKGTILAIWKAPNTRSKLQFISEIPVIPTIKYRPNESLRINGALVPLSYCDIAVYDNTPTSIEFCVLNLENPYTVTLNFSTHVLQNVTDTPCVKDIHTVTTESFKRVKNYVFKYYSPHERKTTTCDVILFERAVKGDHCKHFKTYLGHVSVLVNRTKYDLTQKNPPCNLSLKPDTNYKFSVCLRNHSISHQVSSILFANGSTIHGLASPCFDFVHTPTAATFVSVYVFTLTDECQNSKSFLCKVKLIGSETITTTLRPLLYTADDGIVDFSLPSATNTTKQGDSSNKTEQSTQDDEVSWTITSIIFWTMGLLLLALLILLCIFQASIAGRKRPQEYPKFPEGDQMEHYEDQNITDWEKSETGSTESVGTSVDDSRTSGGDSSSYYN